MAKALFGHMGGVDPRMSAEVRRLQQRLRDLENEVERLQADNDTLRAIGALEHDLHASDLETVKEPALA